MLYYTYEVRGVEYSTSQDASDFHDMLPPDTSVLIGPAGLKYSPGKSGEFHRHLRALERLEAAIPRKPSQGEYSIMKRLVIQAGIAAALVLIALGANKYSAPRSIVHVVTILWKEDSTAEQRQASLEGVKKMAAEIPGIKNVWIKPIKVQGSRPGKDGKPSRSYDSCLRHRVCRSGRSRPLRRSSRAPRVEQELPRHPRRKHIASDHKLIAQQNIAHQWRCNRF